MNFEQQIQNQISVDQSLTEKRDQKSSADNSDQDELNASFHSARSTSETLAMRLDAAPFDPKAHFQSESPNVGVPTNHETEKMEESDVQKELKFQIQERLDKQILVMKAQHQFIQNLQRANLTLKQKIKQLDDITTQAVRDPRQQLQRDPITYGDIVEENAF